MDRRKSEDSLAKIAGLREMTPKLPVQDHNKQSQEHKDAEARVKLGRAGGPLTAERVATMPMADVYEMLQQFADDDGPPPSKRGLRE